MKSIRIIPRLDIKGPNLVKGIHLEGLRVLGKPEDFARYYYESGADELMFMDVVASLYERNSLKEIISKTAQEIFIPLTVGGGLRTIKDIKEVLRAGADKVSLNTAVIKNPDLVKEAALEFGSSTIVVTVEVIKAENGQYLAYTDNGRDYTGVEVLDWAQRVEDYGAGELVVTSVDREGTGGGYDIKLTKMLAEKLTIPVIAHGGPSRLDHLSEAINEGKADAIAIGSMLHYNFIQESKPKLEESREGNVEFLKSNRGFHIFEAVTLKETKEFLIDNGISCRP